MIISDETSPMTGSRTVAMTASLDDKRLILKSMNRPEMFLIKILMGCNAHGMVVELTRRELEEAAKTISEMLGDIPKERAS